MHHYNTYHILIFEDFSHCCIISYLYPVCHTKCTYMQHSTKIKTICEKFKETHIPAKAIWTAAGNIIASTTNNKIYSIITAWSRTPFCLQRNIHEIKWSTKCWMKASKKQHSNTKYMFKTLQRIHKVMHYLALVVRNN